jgi:hypothetical protein
MDGPLACAGVWLDERTNSTMKMLVVYGASGEQRFPDLTDAA